MRPQATPPGAAAPRKGPGGRPVGVGRLVALLAAVILPISLIIPWLMRDQAALPPTSDALASIVPGAEDAAEHFANALLEDDPATVHLWLDAGFDANSPVKGRTSCELALATAASLGRFDVAALLLEHGAQVDATGTEGRTALACAAGAPEDRHDIVRLLLDWRADANRVDNEGFTALMFAAGRGHAETVRLLLENNANRDRRSGTGETAIEMAAREGHTSTFELLKEAGARIGDEVKVHEREQ
jgi:hypothetical protein